MNFSIHIDVDSPRTLLRFYGLEPSDFSTQKLTEFYKVTLNRAIEYFEKRNVKAAFFIVGQEVQSVQEISNLVKEAHKNGYELANHTWSHPFAITRLTGEQQKQEVQECNRFLQSITGETHFGFRAPGCDMNTSLMNLLEENQVSYDSSMMWSSIAYMLKVYKFFKPKVTIGGLEHNSNYISDAFCPHPSDWRKKAETHRTIFEIPLPSSLAAIPWYASFHHMMPGLAVRALNPFTGSDYKIYLMHIIDFYSVSDNLLPENLMHHPGARYHFDSKKKKYNIVLNYLQEHGSFLDTRTFIQQKMKQSKNPAF